MAADTVRGAGKPAPVSRNEYYAGARYASLIDPRMRELRAAVARLVPEGARVIELACGTGDQLMRLSPRIREGVGVDLSDRMLGHAVTRMERRAITNLRFELADAADLSRFPDRSFDTATTSLFIHEIPLPAARAALREMTRLARTLVIADFGRAPLAARAGVALIEMCAGFSHYRHYRAYRRRGGMPALMRETGLEYREAARVFGGAVTVWVCGKD